MRRLEGAIQAVREAVAAAADVPIDTITPDEDLVDDLCLDEIERESLGLILEEVFSVMVPEALWTTPLYRTPAALAEWLIRKSDEADWAEVQRQRRA